MPDIGKYEKQLGINILEKALLYLGNLLKILFDEYTNKIKR